MRKMRKCDIGEVFQRIWLMTLFIVFGGVLSISSTGCGGDEDNDDNTAPVINELVIPKNEVVVGENIVFQVDAHDPDGDVLTYAWAVDDTPLAGTTPTVTWTVPELGASEIEKTVTVKVSVRDDKSNPVVRQKKLTLITLKGLWVGEWKVVAFLDEEGKDRLDFLNALLEELFKDLDLKVSRSMDMNVSKGGTVRFRVIDHFTLDNEELNIIAVALGTYTVSSSNYTIKWEGVLPDVSPPLKDQFLWDLAKLLSESFEEDLGDEENGTWEKREKTLTMSSDDGFKKILEKK